MTAENEPKYSETQLETLVGDGVARQTATLSDANSELQSQVETLTSEKAELATQVATLETEVATERTAKEAAEQQLADSKAEQEEAVEQARLTKERTEAFHEAAGHLFGEDHYTEERAAQWAGMSEEAFAGVLETVSAAAESAGKKGPAPEGDKGKAEQASEQQRETAAFGGGAKPGDKGGAASESSTARQFFAASGRLPAGV